jgi:signal transduction histidine kinase
VSGLDALDPGSPEAETLQLRDIEPLLERARLAGLEVDLAIDGRPIPLSPAIELAAYRVLQEALTNVVKHAPQARTTVQIRYGPATVDLLIKNHVDVGRGTQVPHSAAVHGLVGMRDRVSACGGRLEWTSDPREFAVKAQLPLSG